MSSPAAANRRRPVRTARHLLAAAAVGLALAALANLAPVGAQDPPHWASASIDITCTSQCHTLHSAAGGNLTAAANNVNLCQACHNPAGLARDLAIESSDAAVPRVSGSSHAFDVPALNATLGTQLPLDTAMQLRVMGGNIVCSTCHNQHRSDSAMGGTPRVSPPKQLTALGSTGVVTSGGTWTGPESAWYLIEISSAGTQANARFRYSKDNGLSFFPEQSVGTGVALDNGVTVSFGSGDYVLGERWEFSAAWKFLRAALDVAGSGSAICRDCHRAWDMDHTAVETWDGNFKSHPVGVALGASGSGFSRPVPLDGNGAEQGTGGADTNFSNDLTFDGNGHVQCLTCHGVHFIDSNTQTVDLP